ncbi:MAG TPA: iron-containing alcohol dehydrogenase [Anaerolineaceae bacterium]|nr:iron-containing alcohol dehydrogenase [Anaerolineaceae bacterium]HPN52105.1 iron-containing alcohol dehydrogenase [Anaerolineaceae bacterium]
MQNFSYFNPTRIVFGKGSISHLFKLVPVNQKILMTYGGGSIFKNGVYDQVKQALAGRELYEFGGIEANPTYETLMKAVTLVKQEGIQFLLAVGGGSVLDGTKFVAAAALYEGEDPWDIPSHRGKIGKVLPVASVMTLPATGSEMNGNAVISRKSTQEKLGFGDVRLNPVFSILDPETTFSLPVNQLRNGIVDAFVHVMEQYLTYPVNTPLQDRQAEAVLLTLIEEADAILSDPPQYDARANFMWCATQALNGLLSRGTVGDWATHPIGHELTAFYGMAHGETLAVVYPSMMRFKKDAKKVKMLQYAERVFGLRGLPEEEMLQQAADQTEAFFRRIGIGTRLKEYNVNAAEAAEKISARFAERGWKLGEHEDIDAEAVRQILLNAA